mmetsp:Transcript_16029/g.26265  ORF Transcript_16029/g.26265 Transcript_16029/m.26265 type:complete len:88 (+) Transcript_16029:138-401(+)
MFAQLTNFGRPLLLPTLVTDTPGVRASRSDYPPKLGGKGQQGGHQAQLLLGGGPLNFVAQEESLPSDFMWCRMNRIMGNGQYRIMCQ